MNGNSLQSLHKIIDLRIALKGCAVATKRVVFAYEELNARFQASIVYRIFTKTTQPVHLVAILIVAFVLSLLWPNLVAQDTPHFSGIHETKQTSQKYTMLIYLAVFASHFGTQIWMTFVSGLSLYFNLPRHVFGQCQRILFPRYFTINGILSLIALVLYVKTHNRPWILSSVVQVLVLAFSAVIELTIRLYLAPPMLHLLRIKYRLEATVGVGQEVGHYHEKTAQLDSCYYKHVHASFRLLHTIIAAGNIVTVVCAFVHLHYLASQLVHI